MGRTTSIRRATATGDPDKGCEGREGESLLLANPVCLSSGKALLMRPDSLFVDDATGRTKVSLE